MTRINLLPWREKHIEFQNRRLLFFCASGAVASLAACLILRVGLNFYQDSFNNDVQYLKGEVAKSEMKMNQVSSLLTKKSMLMQRIKLIEQLQVKRNLSAEVLDGLATSLPANILFKELSIKNDVIKITGTASSNNDVSQYLSALEKNKWVLSSSLAEIKVNNTAVEINDEAANYAGLVAGVKFVIEINLKVA